MNKFVFFSFFLCVYDGHQNRREIAEIEQSLKYLKLLEAKDDTPDYYWNDYEGYTPNYVTWNDDGFGKREQS